MSTAQLLPHCCCGDWHHLERRKIVPVFNAQEPGQSARKYMLTRSRGIGCPNQCRTAAENIGFITAEEAHRVIHASENVCPGQAENQYASACDAQISKQATILRRGRPDKLY